MNGFSGEIEVLRKMRVAGVLAAVVLVAVECDAGTLDRSGFDLSDLRIPRGDIRSGGPGKDGIPAILNPKFVKANRAQFLRKDDIVIGYSAGGQTRAYPLRILVWHELVNDTVGGTPIVVSYCPLCATAMVFARRAGGKNLTFGVSGLLYESDVLMYDRQTDSLWSQLKMQAVAGPMAGTKLTWLPSEQMSWEAWRKKYPGSEVLSTETGFPRNYGHTPYKGYQSSGDTMFPVTKYRNELPQKTLVIGVIVNGVAKAYPLDNLTSLRDTVGGQAIRIQYDGKAKHATVRKASSGELIPAVTVYWFAWQAFYPRTQLYSTG